MPRILVSIALTAMAFPIFAWLVHEVHRGTIFEGRTFEYQAPIAILCLLAILVLGFPLVFAMRKYKMLQAWKTVGLATSTAMLPFFLYSLIMVLINPHLLGNSHEQANFITLMAVTGSYGAFCGLMLWALAVYGNPWFTGVLDKEKR